MRSRRDAVVRMALLGRHEVLDADAALHAELVSEVVDDDALVSRAKELASVIAENSPEAVRLTRDAIRSFERDLLKEHMDAGWNMIQSHWPHPDATEGPKAFLERRTPRWEQ